MNVKFEWSVLPDVPDSGDGRELIGFVGNKPVFAIAGGAIANVNDWIPIEYESSVIQRVRMESVAESEFVRHVMRSKTKQIPRSAGMTVSAGTTYTDDASVNDNVLLTARRFIARFKIDEDDLADAGSIINVLSVKGIDWAISYADTFDNACLAVTGTENGTTVPFTSLYKALRTTNSDTSYTADANYLSWDDDLIQISTTGNSLYERLNQTFRLVETGQYWNEADSLVIAHPGWRSALRSALDGGGSPIFVESAGVDSSGRRFDTLFNTRIRWARGAKTSATNTGSPAGNELLFFGNKKYLNRGDRSGPETLVDSARAQDDTDDTAAKFRTRRAFTVGHEKAWSVLERTTDA